MEEIRLAENYQVSFVLGSDAHSPQAVGSVELALARVREAGLSPDRIVNLRKEGA